MNNKKIIYFLWLLIIILAILVSVFDNDTVTTVLSAALCLAIGTTVILSD